MAITNLSFPEYIRYPQWGNREAGSWDRTPASLNTAGWYVCAGLPVPKTGSISKVHWFTGTNSVAGDIDVRIETIDDTTGYPSGTLWGANTEKTVTWSGDYQLMTATLTSAASVTQGDTIAIKLRANSSSVPTGTVAYYDGNISPGTPYQVTNYGSILKDVYALSLWVEYSDGTTPNIGYLRRLSNLATTNINNTTDYRYGIRFQLQFDAIISGAWMQADFGSGSNTLELYDSNGVTVAKTLTIDGNEVRSVNNAQPTYHLFSTDFNVQARAWYRLVFKTTSGSGSAHQVFGQPNVDHLWDVGGFDFICQENGLFEPVHYTYTTAAAAPTAESDWTNDPGQITPMSLLISEISEYSPEVTGVMGLS